MGGGGRVVSGMERIFMQARRRGRLSTKGGLLTLSQGWNRVGHAPCLGGWLIHWRFKVYI